MNRIEAIPRGRDWNYREFSRLPHSNEPFARFANEPFGVRRSERAARKKQAAEELKSPFAESFDAADGHLRDDRRRAGRGELIEAAFDPFEEPIGRRAVQ